MGMTDLTELIKTTRSSKTFTNTRALISKYYMYNEVSNRSVAWLGKV